VVPILTTGRQLELFCIATDIDVGDELFMEPKINTVSTGTVTSDDGVRCHQSIYLKA